MLTNNLKKIKNDNDNFLCLRFAVICMYEVINSMLTIKYSKSKIK